MILSGPGMTCKVVRDKYVYLILKSQGVSLETHFALAVRDGILRIIHLSKVCIETHKKQLIYLKEIHLLLILDLSVDQSVDLGSKHDIC